MQKLHRLCHVNLSGKKDPVLTDLSKDFVLILVCERGSSRSKKAGTDGANAQGQNCSSVVNLSGQLRGRVRWMSTPSLSRYPNFFKERQ